MGSQTWNIVCDDMSSKYPLFCKFIDLLNLQWTNYVLVTMLTDHKERVIMFDLEDKSERIYEWF